MKKYCIYLSFIILIIGCKPEKKAQTGWSLILHLPDKTEHFVTQLPSDLSKPFSIEKSINGFNIKLSLQQYEKYTSFDVKATPEIEEAKCYLSLRYNYNSAQLFSFNEEVIKSEVYRQSPHDPKAWIITGIAAQGMPVIVVKPDSILHIAVSNSSAYYGNFTTQYFNLEEKYAEIASGDNGKGTQPDTINGDKSIFKGCPPVKVMEYYHTRSAKKPHTFNGILFQTNRNGINNIRSAEYINIAEHFKGNRIIIQFDGVYMNAEVWINGQYCGNYPNGYTSFWYDITDKIDFGKSNIIAVKVRNEGENSRWYSGSGIYRQAL